MEIIVCPNCGYGFRDQENKREYVCPREDCRHRWTNLSATFADAFTSEGRRGCPELVAVRGESSGGVFKITQGRTIIGRSPDCEIRLSNLAVSREHAEIIHIQDHVAIRDLGSRTGTMVNGKAANNTELYIGDQILIAGNLFEFRVRFEADAIVNAIASQIEEARYEIHQYGLVTDRIKLDQDVVSFGRSSARDVVIAHPLLSRKHAIVTISANHDGWDVIDTKSATGTFVNGKAVIRAALYKGDRVQFGPLAFVFDGKGLEYQRSFETIAISARNLVKTVEDGNRILDGVSLEIQAGELVGLIGPSGSGKTTLLNALSHFKPASEGAVRYNGIDLAEHHTTLKNRIGYVPQDDIIHPELTPRESLTFAGRLRLPADTSPEEIKELVDGTLGILGIEERADLPISHLSGGQRKRVNVGVELLTHCNVLFMDEPTSGLDPATISRLMRLFRRLADQGRTVVLTTHVMENLDLLDKVAVMSEGKLTYFGSPDGAKAFFGTERATLLYDRLEEASADTWRDKYLESEDFRQMVKSPLHPTTLQPPPEGVEHARREAIKQLRVLTRRYLRITLSDRRRLALIIAQPIVIFVLICLVFRFPANQAFMAAVAIFWVGTTNAAREIVRERSVFRRERSVNLSIAPYVLSKVGIISVISAIQVVVATSILKLGGLPGSPLLIAVILVVASLSGMALGLGLSAFATRPEHADSMVPIAVIPQILFAGVIEGLDSMNPPSQLVSFITTTRWSYDGLISVLRQTDTYRFWTDTAIVTGFAIATIAITTAALWWRERDNGTARATS